MLKVIYWQYYIKNTEEIDNISSVKRYEDLTEDGMISYICTIDENCKILHSASDNNLNVGDKYVYE
jgi:hypothetical protein